MIRKVPTSDWRLQSTGGQRVVAVLTAFAPVSLTPLRNHTSIHHLSKYYCCRAILITLSTNCTVLRPIYRLRVVIQKFIN